MGKLIANWSWVWQRWVADWSRTGARIAAVPQAGRGWFAGSRWRLASRRVGNKDTETKANNNKFGVEFANPSFIMGSENIVVSDPHSDN